MKGSYQIIVQNNRVQYKFTINRNLTILRGKSGSGKTSLINMIGQYVADGVNSGINISCDVAVYVLTQLNWKLILDTLENTIVFIDEGSDFVKTKEFAEKVKNSSNYYVISVRDNIPTLPYSVDEIYTLHNTTKKYGNVKRLYTNIKRIYTDKEFLPSDVSKPDYVIVEDGNSGFQFFSEFFSKKNVPCVSAQGKAKIYSKILENTDSQNILVIADGAAFGPEIEKILKLKYKYNITVFLPESFEWLILSSGIINKAEIKKVLETPSDFIESKQYFSWERFFTEYLIEQSADTYLKYSKSKLKKEYLQEKEFNSIINQFPDAIKLM